MKARPIVVCLCILTGCWLTSFQRPPKLADKGPIKTIVIDAGHGGKDPGAVGKSNHEKTLNLQVAMYLRTILKANMPNVRVVMTRGSDRFVPLHKRAKIAQAYQGDFFISIHCNASPRSDRFGSSSYILGINKGQGRYESYIRENESVLFEDDYKEVYGGFDPKTPEGFIFFKVLKNVFRQESLYLASKIQDQFEDKLGRKNMGVKQAPFIVLWQSGMPSILCELGFISNENEEKFLASEAGQIHLASSLYRAIKDYNNEFTP
ncbi:N-acetylmuramoyl-L-alanine amidase [bacterium]|nr:N-acetylmuramoyl-L-alanine amidase [bacterium]